MKISIVAKKVNNKWYIGFVDGDVFTINKEIKKLSDVKDITGYMTLKRYLKEKKLEPTLEKEMHDMFNFKSVYVLEKPIEPTDEEFESYWWNDLNAVCEKCTYACKQSKKVIIHFCPSFVEKNGEVNEM